MEQQNSSLGRWENLVWINSNSSQMHNEMKISYACRESEAEVWLLGVHIQVRKLKSFVKQLNRKLAQHIYALYWENFCYSSKALAQMFNSEQEAVGQLLT